MTDTQRAAGEYDVMALQYSADNTAGSYNAYYERPATIALLGEVQGLRVLDVGCGGGQLSEWLAEQGAVVTAFDVSQAMVDIARARLGDRASVLVADVAEPLFFAGKGEFDLVVVSLVMHYVRDWEEVLTELRRVLSPRGALVFSTHHPTMDWPLSCPEDYFAIKQVTDTWEKAGGEFQVTFWRRPLTAMCEAIFSAGFLIERLVEPEPLATLASHDPASYLELSTRPRFLFFRLRPSQEEV